MGVCTEHFVPNCIICSPRPMGGNVMGTAAAHNAALTGKVELPPAPLSVSPDEKGTLKGTPVQGLVAVPSELVGQAAQIKAAGDELATAIQRLSEIDQAVEKAVAELERLRKLYLEFLKARETAQKKLLDMIGPVVVQSEV